MTAIAAERYTGASIKRSEDPRILTGAGRYVDDIKLPGMLHAAFVRSPMAHARVLSVDVSAARALPGVVAVLTGADLEAMTVPGPDALMALMGWAGPPRSSPCSRPTRCASSAIPWRSSSPRAVTSPRTAASWWRSSMTTCLRSWMPPSRSTRPARRCSPTWVTTSPARTRATSSATSPARSPTLTASSTSTSTCTGTRTCPWRDAAASRVTTPTPGVMTVHAATQSVHVTRIAVAMRLGIEQ